MRASTFFQLDRASLAGGHAVSWIDATGRKRRALASAALLHEPMAMNRRARVPATHPQKRNTQGYYWFSQLEKHVWFESMEEYSALMYLDHTENVSGVSAQPMRIDFDDNRFHFPDYLLAYERGRQELVNVRPAALIDERAQRQFATLTEVCSTIGWSHRVFDGLAPAERFNLEWIAAYRHGRHEPNAEVESALFGVIGDGQRFGAIWSFCRRQGRPHVLAGLYNLMWRREIVFDLSRPFAMDTLLRSAGA